MTLKLYNYGTLNEPRRAHYYDAGIDVYLPDNNDVIINAHDYVIINLRFGLDIPAGMFGYLCGRSSLALNGILVHSAPIDTGYTSEIHAILFNCSNNTVILNHKKAIAQLIINNVQLPLLVKHLDSHYLRGVDEWNGSTDREDNNNG